MFVFMYEDAKTFEWFPSKRLIVFVLRMDGFNFSKAYFIFLKF